MDGSAKVVKITERRGRDMRRRIENLLFQISSNNLQGDIETYRRPVNRLLRIIGTGKMTKARFVRMFKVPMVISCA